MRNVPSIDLAKVRIPEDDGSSRDAVRRLREFTTQELKDELLSRDCVDFSKWEVLIKLSPFILLLAMGFAWQIKEAMNGEPLLCLL